jgi:cytochrome c
MYMRRSILVFFSTLAVAYASSTPLLADEHGTRDQAVAMAKAVIADIKTKGLDAVYQDINDKKYNQADLYPFIDSFDGFSVAHGMTKALVGKNLIDLKDQNGKLMIRDMAATASKGSGWVDYMWSNPITKKADSKSSYVEKIDDKVFIGVGVYNP